MSMLWMAVAGWFLVSLQYQKRTRCSYTNIYLGKDPINFMPHMLVSRTLKKAYCEIQKPRKVLYTQSHYAICYCVARRKPIRSEKGEPI